MTPAKTRDVIGIRSSCRRYRMSASGRKRNYRLGWKADITDLAEARIFPLRSDISTFAAGWSHIRSGNRSFAHCPEASEPSHLPRRRSARSQIAGLPLDGAQSRDHKRLRSQNAPDVVGHRRGTCRRMANTRSRSTTGLRAAASSLQNAL
jgi:hypothetical protein